MRNFKSRANTVNTFFLILCFAVFNVRADTGKRSLFVGNPGLFDGNYLPRLNNLPADEQSGLMYVNPQMSSDKIAMEILAGIVGNVALGVGLAYLGDTFPDRSESIIGGGAVLGYCAGSLCGSALGVYLVGNAGNAKGKSGMALLGSLLGELAAFGIALSMQSNTSDIEGLVVLLSMAILPPLGATILFNSSLRYRSLPEGNGLLNLNKDELTLSIPDIQLRPLVIYGKNMKAEFQFKINLLSVVL